MESNIDIKELWSKQFVPYANQSDILKRISKFRKKSITRVVILNLILLLTIFFILFIWIYFKPQYLSSKIGIILTIIPISLVIITNYKLIPSYRKMDESRTNLEYLNDLLVIKEKEYFMQTTVMNLYSISLSLGICLYMYEYALMRSLLFGIIAYSTLLSWVCFNYFFLRPRTIKKNKDKIDHLIKQIETICT